MITPVIHRNHRRIKDILLPLIAWIYSEVTNSTNSAHADFVSERDFQVMEHTIL